MCAKFKSSKTLKPIKTPAELETEALLARMAEREKEINENVNRYRNEFKESDKFGKCDAETQMILSIKTLVSRILEADDPKGEKHYYVRGHKTNKNAEPSNGQAFGFSECMVNQLMLHMYRLGIKSGIEMGKNAYDTELRKKMLDLLNVNDDDLKYWS